MKRYFKKLIVALFRFFLPSDSRFVRRSHDTPGFSSIRPARHPYDKALAGYVAGCFARNPAVPARTRGMDAYRSSPEGDGVSHGAHDLGRVRAALRRAGVVLERVPLLVDHGLAAQPAQL